jgi:YVTN family beta-propeller protein
MKKTIKVITAAAVMLVSSTGLFAQGYHVVKTFHIVSDGGWDYIAVSPVTDNIYVAHATQVNILNKATGDSAGVIPNTAGVHGIAFAPEFKKGFTSNGRLNTVTVFDINTNAVLAEIKTGENPDAIIYDPFTKKVYTCNGRSKNLSVIDPATNEVIKTVELGGKPETPAADKGKVYINIEDKNEIAVINTKTWTVDSRWKTGTGSSPSGLAIDTKTKRLFAGCDNKVLVVLNAENGRVVKELPIGDGCDGVAFDPGTKTVYSSNGEGTLTVINEKSANDYEVVEQAATQKGARTIAVDEKTHLVYLPTADFMPAPADQAAHTRRGTVPGTFRVLVVGK